MGWPAVTLTRLQTRPTEGAGVLVGDDDWYFVVEALFPMSDDSLWGVATWNDGTTGNGIWSEVDWTDITASVRGCSWRRGSSQFGGRPETGVATLMLGNTDGTWSPWGDHFAAAYFAPGTIIRIGCLRVSALLDESDNPLLDESDAELTASDSWVPQFCGVVESWPVSFAEAGRESFVTVTVVEPTATLAEINENALGSPVGADDSPQVRVARLLDDAEWPFGLYPEVGVPLTELQSTDMADNRLTECHLTVDSADMLFFNHRSGIGLLTRADARERPEWPQNQPGEEWRNRPVLSEFPAGVEFVPSGTAVTAAPGFTLGATESLSVPDAANLDFSGDFSVVVDLADFDTPAASTAPAIAAKWTTGSEAWQLALTSNRLLQLTVEDSLGAQTSYSHLLSAVPMWDRVTVAVTFDASNGANSVGRFWALGEFGDWVFLGGQLQTIVGTVANSTAGVTLGDHVGSTNDGLPATYYRVELYNSIGTDGAVPTGTPVLSIQPEDTTAVSTAASSFTATSGQTVTITGSGVLTGREQIVYAADEAVFSNDLDAIYNDVRLARAGGSQQVAEDDISIGRWKKRRTYARSDLLTGSDSDVLAIAEAIRDRRSNVVLRPEAVTVQARPSTPSTNVPALFTVDVGDPCQLVSPDGDTRTTVSVAAVEHSVAGAGENRVQWTARFGFDVFSEAT